LAAAFDAFVAISLRALHFRERFAVTRPTCLGAFLSLIAAETVPSVNQQFPLAGWALPTRRDDNRMHRSVDDLLFAERASKGMVKEIEFDGTHGRNSNKKGFRLSFATNRIAGYATRKD